MELHKGWFLLLAVASLGVDLATGFTLDSLHTVTVRRTQYFLSGCLKDIAVDPPTNIRCLIEPDDDFFLVIPSASGFCLQYKNTGLELPLVPIISLDLACDNVDTGENDTALIIVYILDNVPPVVSNVVPIEVAVTTTSGSVIFSVEATDEDGDTLTFTMTNTPDGFNLEDNGDITATQDSALLDLASITLTGSVADGHGHNEPFQVHITLDMVNSPPTVNNIITETYISEDATPGDSVWEMDIIDPVLPGTPSITTVTPPEGRSKFEFLGNDLVVDAGGFNFDTQASYDIDITVSDGYKSVMHTITVHILDTNDPPACGQPSYAATIEEGSGSFIPTPDFNITDNVGDMHTVTIGGPYAANFIVHYGSQLTITPTPELDFEGSTGLPNTMTLTLVVEDDEKLKGTCDLVVTVTDRNDNNPQFEQSTYYADASIRLPLGAKLISLSYTDADSSLNDNNVVTCSLKDPPSAEISVLPNCDILTARNFIQADYGSSVQETVIATDGGGLTSEAVIVFRWNTAPDMPNFVSQGTISEDTVTEKSLYTIPTFDAENDTVTCETGAVDPPTAPFYVKPEGGGFAFYYSGAVDLTTVSPKIVTVDAKCLDYNGGSTTKTYTITLVPNKSPQASCSSVFTSVSASNTGTGDTVYTPTIIDPENNTITVSYTCTPDVVTWSTARASLVASQPFQGVTDPTIVCDLSINDDKHTPDEAIDCKITITLTDPNVAPVVLPPNGQVVQWIETTVVGEVLHTFSVKDAQNLTLAKTFIPSAGSSKFEIVEIPGDPHMFQVVLKELLDYETLPNVYNVSVEFSDGFFKAADFVQIEVLNGNDPPIFSSEIYSIVVNEGPGGNASVNLEDIPGWNVTDTDGDIPTLRVIVEDATFVISGTILSNKVELDRDVASTPDSYNVVVEADDLKNGKATATVIVHVNLLNDNKPQFNPTAYECVVGLLDKGGKDLAGNCPGGPIMATDADAGPLDGTLTYTAGSMWPAGQFRVNAAGEIFLDADLNPSNYGQPMFMEVVVSDEGTNPGKLTDVANVTFRWNERPVCQPPVEVSIAEDQEDGLVLDGDITVSDTEGDTVYGSLRCFPAISSFVLTPTFTDTVMNVEFTGAPPNLDHATQSEYRCELTCEDKQGGQDKKNFTVKVTKNRKPEVTCSNAILDVDGTSTEKDAVLPLPPDIRIRDPEDDTLSYTAIFAPADSVFSMIAATGDIKVTDDIARQKAESVTVTMTIDDGHFGNQVECVFTILVNPVNEAPVIGTLNEPAYIDETADCFLGGNLFVDNPIRVTDDGLSCPTRDPVYTVTMTLPYRLEDRDKFVATMVEKRAKREYEIEVTLAPGEILDYEDTSETVVGDTHKYSFDLVVSDGCRSSVEKRINVNVRDCNEMPEFRGGTNYDVSFRETETVCKELDCRGYDDDTGDIDKWTWKITKTTPFNIKNENYYTVQQSTTTPGACEICLKKEYDLDEDALELEEMTLEVEVVDDDLDEPLTATMTIGVTVTEENDNSPELTTTTINPGTFNNLQSGGRRLIPSLTFEDVDVGKNGEYECEKIPGSCGAIFDEYITVGPDCDVNLATNVQIMGDDRFHCQLRAKDKGDPTKYSEVVTVELQYTYITTTPPPPPTTADPNANANANANANGNGNGNLGSGVNQALNNLANGGAGSGGGSGGLAGGTLDAGTVAGIAVGAAAGALVAGVAIAYGVSKLMAARAARKKMKPSNPKSYKVTTPDKKNNRIHSSSSVHLQTHGINSWTDPSQGATRMNYLY